MLCFVHFVEPNCCTYSMYIFPLIFIYLFASLACLASVNFAAGASGNFMVPSSVSSDNLQNYNTQSAIK